MGIGIVMRNHEGQVVMVKSVRLNLGFPEAAEAASILHAVQLTIAGGYRRICCESDAKTIIENLNDPLKASCHWSTVGFIRKILKLRPAFHDISFTWIPRNNNKLAHFISKRSLLHYHTPLLLYLENFDEAAYQDGSSSASP